LLRVAEYREHRGLGGLLLVGIAEGHASELLGAGHAR
jgi:hypothetical protein